VRSNEPFDVGFGIVPANFETQYQKIEWAFRQRPQRQECRRRVDEADKIHQMNRSQRYRRRL
jgi:hypothetical protein